MGIKGLFKLLKEFAPNSIHEKDEDEYHGKTIAIDVSLLLYQVIIAIRKSGSDILNEEGKSVSHLYGIFMKTTQFVNKGIKPLYIFDGKPPELKYDTLQVRKTIKEQSLIKMNEAQDPEERIKYFKRSVIITKEQFGECKELLNLMGIPFIDSPGEADAQCAYLAKKGLIWGVCTEDMDLLAFGTTRLLRNMLTMKSDKIIELELAVILKELGITYEQFVDISILLGCDYCPTIKLLGYKKALKMIKTYKNLDGIVNMIKSHKLNFKLPDNYKYKETEEYFKNPLVKDFDINITWKPSDKIKIIEYMCDKHGFNHYNINKKINNFNFELKKLLDMDNPIIEPTVAPIVAPVC